MAFVIPPTRWNRRGRALFFRRFSLMRVMVTRSELRTGGIVTENTWLALAIIGAMLFGWGVGMLSRKKK